MTTGSPVPLPAVSPSAIRYMFIRHKIPQHSHSKTELLLMMELSKFWCFKREILSERIFYLRNDVFSVFWVVDNGGPWHVTSASRQREYRTNGSHLAFVQRQTKSESGRRLVSISFQWRIQTQGLESSLSCFYAQLRQNRNYFWVGPTKGQTSTAAGFGIRRATEGQRTESLGLRHIHQIVQSLLCQRT